MSLTILKSKDNWVINNGDIGSISGGVFNPSATTPGGGTITATYAKNGASDTASVTVFEVQSISVAPVTANLTSGQTQNFSATVLDESSVNRTSLVSGEISWSADSVLGSLSPTTGSASTLTAGQVDASGKVTASIDGKSGEANVTVVAPETFTININNTAAKDDDNIGVGENIPITIVSSNPKSSKTVVIKSNNMQKAYFGNQSASASITLSQGSGTVSIYGGQTASSAKNDVNIYVVGGDGLIHLSDVYLTVVSGVNVSYGQNILFANGQHAAVISGKVKVPAIASIPVMFNVENKNNPGTSVGSLNPKELLTSNNGIAQAVYVSGTTTWHDDVAFKVKGTNYTTSLQVFNYGHADLHDFTDIYSEYNDQMFKISTITVDQINKFLDNAPGNGKPSILRDFKEWHVYSGILPQRFLAAEMIKHYCDIYQINPKIVLAIIERETGLVSFSGEINEVIPGNGNVARECLKNPMGINPDLFPIKDFDYSTSLGVQTLNSLFNTVNTDIKNNGYHSAYLVHYYTKNKYQPTIYSYTACTGVQWKYNPSLNGDFDEGVKAWQGALAFIDIFRRQASFWK